MSHFFSVKHGDIPGVDDGTTLAGKHGDIDDNIIGATPLFGFFGFLSPITQHQRLNRIEQITLSASLFNPENEAL